MIWTHNIGLFVPLSSVRNFLEKNRANDSRPAQTEVANLVKQDEKHLQNAAPAATIKSASESRMTTDKVRANTAPIIEIEKEVETGSVSMPRSASRGASSAIYTVHEGDDLAKIASRFNVSIQELISINNIRNPNALVVGAKLTLPERSVSQ